MLSLKNIAVHYGGVQALKGISLEVEEGTITCLIGANGAGKSTTLRAISGIVPLTSGEIWFQDRRIDGMEPEEIVEMGIGHVPEGKRLFLEMSVRDNLLIGAHLRREKEFVEQDLQRVFNYFPLLGTAAAKPASKMSGGEQQMIAIGRGLMGAPKLLLLDEPSLGLSPILTRDVGSIIKKIAEEGVSILLIEQNANLALQLARKCYVLETGKIALEGASKDLQDNEHVRAAYLGISCTLDSITPAASVGRAKDKGRREAETAKPMAAKWQDLSPPAPEPERRVAEPPPAEMRAPEPALTAVGRPDSLGSGPRLPEVSLPGGARHANRAAAQPNFGGGPAATEKKETFSRMAPTSNKDQLARVVKKVFAPKKI
ncbi:MAG: ATP-binding cassette domain-containing protein [Desulfobacterales bacterium]|nr:MAG: ATP-binding cassette domain-containing protein [Desulfobacterales bacterium]